MATRNKPNKRPVKSAKPSQTKPPKVIISDGKKLRSAIYNLAILLLSLFLIEYLFHVDSIIIYLGFVFLIALVVWKALRTLHELKECKVVVGLLTKTAFVISVVLTILYIFSGPIFDIFFQDLDCEKEIDCTWDDCPISYDIEDLCYFSKQFLVANIRFNILQVLCLVLALEFAARILK
ncbi:MAG: hypothetical protein ABIJ34_02285 [archaeon]